MQARQLWDAVEDGEIDFHDDRWAFKAILATIPPELGATLADKNSPKQAWEANAVACIGVDCVR